MTDDPIPYDKDLDAYFKGMIDKLKAKDPDFDLHVNRGQLMMEKREDELTDEECAFLAGEIGTPYEEE